MAKKPKKEKPFGACDYCWQYHDAENVVVPHISDDANLILVKDWPFSEHSQPDRFLASLCSKQGLRPIFISARSCLGVRVPLSLDEIKRNRMLNLVPALEECPTLPVVVMGEFASKLLIGGNPTETSMVNKVQELFGHQCAFTYSIDYYLRERKPRVLEHITTTLEASIRPPVVEFRDKEDPETLIVDVEGNSVEFPFAANSRINLVGIKPLGGRPRFLTPDQARNEAANLAKQAKVVVGHGITFDLVHLAHSGIVFPGARVHDTLIYHKNLFPNEDFNGLKYLAKRYHNFPHWESWFNTQIEAGLVDPAVPEQWEKLIAYNSYDLFATEALYRSQQREYAPFQLEMDYLKYVVQMIMNGFHVDKQQLGWMLMDVTARLACLVGEARERFALGRDFNFASPPQVLAFLRREVDADITGTGADVLVDYVRDHPFIESLLAIRDLTKLKGTGLEGLQKYMDSNSLVHSSVSVHGAETGRSSSSSPNLQNTDPRVRPLFVSRYIGGRLLHTDLSGIEYRLIGHASCDKELMYVFNSGIDIHDRTYERLFHKPPPTKEERKIAKTCNFLGVYGGGYPKFLIASGLPDCPNSKSLYSVVSGLYPGVEAWRKEVINDLWRTKCVRNLFGRIRRFDVVDMDAEREAVNWIIQSSGHDILDIYLMELCDRLEADCPRTLLAMEVHDSVTFDSPAEEWGKASHIINELAANLNPLIWEMFGIKMKVPVVAEVEVLTKWA